MPELDFDTRVKLCIYDRVAKTTVIPDVPHVAELLNSTAADVRAAFSRLFSKRLLVPEPGSDTRIRMAPPFSGIKTPFPVKIEDRVYYANCVWDALGVAAALHQDADINTPCPDCGENILLQVKDGSVIEQDCIIHFAIPAAKWWDDIIYT